MQNSFEFDELKKLLLSSEWPLAAAPDQICNFNVEDEKLFRAENILNVFGLSKSNLEGKRFLDFGCGEGHLVLKAKERGAIALGFDIEDNFLKNTNCFFTSTWANIENYVSENGKFDIIVLYDVLDHLLGDTDLIFKNISSVSKGLIYVRTHPFCSRHGFHLYYQMNKAFIHLIFSEKELSLLGVKPNTFTKGVTFPTEQYRIMLQNYFRILESIESKTLVDDFFLKNQLVLERIKKYWYKDNDLDSIVDSMSLSFIDFLLVNYE
jgi:2-polyprenyl-3-methyl-5-hydroxy-6-metoxy-1,4-benzoquinol methylase